MFAYFLILLGTSRQKWKSYSNFQNRNNKREKTKIYIENKLGGP